jgi:hypothetical protein
MEFENEILILDTIFEEMSDTMMNKPQGHEYEEMRLFTENTLKMISKWVKGISQVRGQLNDREEKDHLTADNRPA